MTQAEMAALMRMATTEPPMTKVALHDIANEQAVRQQLRREFERSIRNHESKEQLFERIQRVCDMSRSRAMTIAQTERTRAVNGQRYADAIREYAAAYQKAVRGHRKRPEKPVFQWINPRTAKDPRKAHVAISGSTCEIGKPFLPGVLYPGDPKAPAHETINCHCYIRRMR